MERVTVYIDGLNFYYALRRAKVTDRDWQKFYWLDIVKFFELFMGNNQVLQKVVYFTTPPINIQKKRRQALLLNANRLLNGNRFEFIKGKFLETPFTCPVCKNTYNIPEEKHTDVNISIQMMRDCALNRTDAIILVSADSDLVTPLKLIKMDYPQKRINVYFPPYAFSNNLNGVMIANRGKAVRLEKNKPKFFKAVMPDSVTKSGTTYTIPPEWKI